MGDLGQAFFTRSSHENVIFRRKSHNCAGTAFVQGDSLGGSKLTEQTLLYAHTVDEIVSVFAIFVKKVLEVQLCAVIGVSLLQLLGIWLIKGYTRGIVQCDKSQQFMSNEGN